jgi:hypothetical protein
LPYWSSTSLAAASEKSDIGNAGVQRTRGQR